VRWPLRRPDRIRWRRRSGESRVRRCR
jgi:hypothetical protein